MDSCSASWGALSVWGVLTTFPCKFGPKFFSALGSVHVHPVHPLATSMLSTLKNPSKNSLMRITVPVTFKI